MAKEIAFARAFDIDDDDAIAWLAALEAEEARRELIRKMSGAWSRAFHAAKGGPS